MLSKMAEILSLNTRFKALIVGHGTVSILQLTAKSVNNEILWGPIVYKEHGDQTSLD